MSPNEPNPPIDPELLELERQLKGAPRPKTGPVKVSRTSAKLLGAKKGDVVDTVDLKRKEALRERRLKKWALIATVVFVLLVVLFGIYKFVIKGGGRGGAHRQTPSQNGSSGGGGTRGPAPTITAEVREYQRLMGEFRTLKVEVDTFMREQMSGEKSIDERAPLLSRLGEYRDRLTALRDQLSELKEPGRIPDNVYAYYLGPRENEDQRELDFVRQVNLQYTSTQREIERQNAPPSNP